MLIVSRTVTELRENDQDTGTTQKRTLTLAELHDHHAFILLGDPGAGKSTTFQVEAALQCGELIKAGDFIALEQRAEYWHGKTIFIDALDESRAGSVDGRTALDAIRRKLEQLGHPRFRVSCRAADWLGQSDASKLRALSPSESSFGVYQLDPLTVEDVERILAKNFQVADTDAFINLASQNRVDELLFNPQTLEMLAKAVGKENNWPASRSETYQIAVDKLLLESNQEHRVAKKKSAPTQELLLAAAGYLSCIYLIADVQGFNQLSEGFRKTVALKEIDNPDNFPLSRCLETPIFKSVGSDIFAPIHRTVAEYVAARFLAKAFDAGLPTGRALAMMCGSDGGVVTNLRGLHAWLAVCSATARKKLIANDPLGVLLYGDVKSFSTKEKIAVLEELHREAVFSPSFRWRDRTGQPFGALATPDMVAEFQRILQKKPESRADEALAYCIVEALEYGESLDALRHQLTQIIQSSSWSNELRKCALFTYLKKYSPDFSFALKLLEDIRNDLIEDNDDELAGTLLRALYPEHLTPEAALRHLHLGKSKLFSGNYSMFWHYDLLHKTTAELTRELITAVASIPLELKNGLKHEYGYWTMVSSLLVRVLTTHGDNEFDTTIFDWLGICLDEYDHSHLEQEDAIALSVWFAARPERYKGVLRIALTKCANPEDLYPWRAVHRLHSVQPPEDIAAWWFLQALVEPNQQVAESYFRNTVRIDDEGNMYGVSLEQLESWASQRIGFEALLKQYLVCEVDKDNWRVERSRKKREYLAEKKARAESFRLVLPQLLDNTANPHTLDAFACAYLGHYYRVSGDTPALRVSDLINGDTELVKAATTALKNTTVRSDLPTVSEILASDAKGKIFYLTRPLLVGLELLFETEVARILSFTDDFLLQAIISRLIYSAGNEPAWFEYLVMHRPKLVAQAYIAYTRARHYGRTKRIHGAHLLAYENDYQEVAKQVIPTLLTEFPLKAKKEQLSVLEDFIRGAIRLLPQATLVTMALDKLESKSMDVGQNVYWLATGLLVDPTTYETKLNTYIGKNQKRRTHLNNFLYRRIGVNETPLYRRLALHF